MIFSLCHLLTVDNDPRKIQVSPLSVPTASLVDTFFQPTLSFHGQVSGITHLMGHENLFERWEKKITTGNKMSIFYYWRKCLTSSGEGTLFVGNVATRTLLQGSSSEP